MVFAHSFGLRQSRRTGDGNIFNTQSETSITHTVMSWTTLARRKVTRLSLRRFASDSSQKSPELVETDDCAIPLKPTWSVDDLLSSYPRPTISSPALHRLHILSALTPPEEGTPEYVKLSRELEDLVKLVESVRLFEGPGASSPVDTAVDARIWAEGTGIDLKKAAPGDRDQEALDPAELLSMASRTEKSLYVIYSDRATRKLVLVDGESCY